jgi:uncharacterized coiled-coil protein SlyX
MDNAGIEIAQLKIRTGVLEREVKELKEALAESTRDISEVSTDLKLAVQELRNAAQKPYDKLAVGWRVLAGVGTTVIGFVVVIGGLIGILDHFTKHN